MNPLTVSGLYAGYSGSPLLQDINFTLQPGTITTIIGPNGCGKTTLLRAVAGLIPHQSGSIQLFGRETENLSRRSFAKQLGFMPQLRQIPAISTESYVLYGRFPHLGARKPSLQDIAVAEAAMEQTSILSLRRRRLTELSGGERQRVYFAMLIAQDPAIWLLDEPTTYLDINFQFELLNLIEQQRDAGKTILMVLHDLSHAFTYSNQLLVMKAGRLLRTGTPLELSGKELMPELFHVRLAAEVPADRSDAKVFYHLHPLPRERFPSDVH